MDSKNTSRTDAQWHAPAQRNSRRSECRNHKSDTDGLTTRLIVAPTASHMGMQDAGRIHLLTADKNRIKYRQVAQAATFFFSSSLICPLPATSSPSCARVCDEGSKGPGQRVKGR